MKLAAVCLSSLLCVIACKTNPEQAAAPAAAVSASTRANPHKHPPIPARKRDYEAEAVAIERARAAAAAAPSATVQKVAWRASCQVNRECAGKQRPLPVCAAPRPKFTWSDVQHDAESMLGKEVETVGNLGVTPSAPIKGGACKPGECCHSLRFAMVVDGSPTALPLAGYSCSGDDSKLCCTVENEGQEVVAKGRLAKAPAGSIAKWQLLDASLCTPPRAPEGMTMGGGM
jgi:hypothetical protein